MVERRAMPKDDLWWVHPAYRGQQTLGIGALTSFPAESFRWVHSTDEIPALIPSRDPAHGPFAALPRILFMLNGYRPGPVLGWYVVVNTVAEKEWCVGQLCADAMTPLRLFADLRFTSEEVARKAAQDLRQKAVSEVRAVSAGE